MVKQRMMLQAVQLIRKKKKGQSQGKYTEFKRKSSTYLYNEYEEPEEKREIEDIRGVNNRAQSYQKREGDEIQNTDKVIHLQWRVGNRADSSSSDTKEKEEQINVDLRKPIGVEAES